ncbi:hypothetical protein BDA99DRAFT_27755 [Phascolomyces articulosus]|uniref:Nitrogen regulatory protein areA GATA-like domain-containing protein n=1 Tax=Phascolomyces articulosus TaxID=60185 RepID=A0AAD5PEY0_9FUNG|nr:hypothetical protein BDA99DRAFT_27755 [Phascolomyces articulosus]
MDRTEKKRPSLHLQDLERHTPSEKDLKNAALSPSTPSGVAASLLEDSLFPPRKPKTSSTMTDDDITHTNHHTQQQKDGSDEENVDGQSKQDPLATQVWRLYTKAKDTLPNASRMENLTWRMMAMTLNKNKSKSSTPSTPATEKTEEEDDLDEENKMFIDNENNTLGGTRGKGAETATSPPAPDDTTELLSSSAPPYTIDFFSGGPPFQKSIGSPGATTPRQNRQSSNPRNKSVFVYGSARATTSTSSCAATPSSPSTASPHVTEYNVRFILFYFVYLFFLYVGICGVYVSLYNSLEKKPPFVYMLSPLPTSPPNLFLCFTFFMWVDCSQVNGSNSITIPVDMPVDSDMEDSMSSSHREPASPLSMSSPFAGSLDSTNAFLSHSLPNYHPHIPAHGPNGSNAGMLPHHPMNSPTTSTAAQARSSSSSMYMNSSSIDAGTPPSTSFSPRLNVPQVNNPGAMSFEELFSMYYAGGGPGTHPTAVAAAAAAAQAGTSPTTSTSFDGHMLSSLMAHQGANDGSLSHIDPTQLESGSGSSHPTSVPFGMATSGKIFYLLL